MCTVGRVLIASCEFAITISSREKAPLYLVVDMVQTAYFRRCIMHLEYKPPSSLWPYLLAFLCLLNARLAVYKRRSVCVYCSTVRD